MAVYTYKCRKCQKPEELTIPITEPNPASIECGACGSEASRVWSATPVIFSGQGFYSTDSRSQA